MAAPVPEFRETTSHVDGCCILGLQTNIPHDRALLPLISIVRITIFETSHWTNCFFSNCQKNSVKDSSTSHPCPSTLQSIHEWVALLDYTHIYETEEHERCVLSKLQRGLAAVNSWYGHWNVKKTEGKSQAISFPRKLQVTGNVLQLAGRDTVFVNKATCLMLL
jgi:hypothetical protein